MKNKAFCLFVVINMCFAYSSKAQNSLIPHNYMWNVTDFDAKGDGKTLNTNAFQKAIDNCAASGGGIVKVSTGCYIIGTIFLRSNVQLQIDTGAELLGSPNRQDYAAIPQKAGMDDKFFLIYAENAEHISITGNGKINGNGNSFWQNEMLSELVRKPKSWRPSGLIGFVNCRFLTINRLFLTNSPCYTIWALGCDDATFEGITIRNATDGPNTDGIDIDCCRRVLVTNCNIEGGDDAIAIKSDSGRLGEFRACEDIIVSNCIISSPPACGIRVGYEGDSPIRNCILSNLTIRNSNHGINMISVLPDPNYPCAIFEGTKIENIQFDNIIMHNVSQPIYLWMGNEKPELPFLGYMKNIRISNVTATNVGNSLIGSALEGKYIEDIALSNIKLFPDKNVSENTYVNVWGSRHPYILYVKNVSGLSINDLKVDFSSTKEIWEQVLHFENASEIRLNVFSVIKAKEIPLKHLIFAENSVLQISRGSYKNRESHFFIKKDSMSKIDIKD